MKGGAVSQSQAVYTGDQSMTCGIVTTTLVTTTTTTTTKTTTTTTTKTTYGKCSDYGTLIELSTQFYEAQRSGKLPNKRRVTWKKDSGEI